MVLYASGGTPCGHNAFDWLQFVMPYRRISASRLQLRLADEKSLLGVNSDRSARQSTSADQTKNAAVGAMPLRRIKYLLASLYFIPDCPENFILLRSRNGFPRNVL